MKRTIHLLALSIMLVFVAICAAGCGGGATTSTSGVDSEGLLPARIEQLSSGGVVPEGSEPVEGEEGAYPIESLWGEWVLVDEDVKIEQTIKTKTASDVGEDGEIEEGDDIEIKIFPQTLYFLPWWVEAENMNSLTLSNTYASYNFSLTSLLGLDEIEETTYEDTLLGAVLREWNCCPGYASFDYIEPEDSLDALSFIWNDGYRLAYKISGNTLALGLLSTSSDESNEFDITEIDYEISFTGYQLTLTYGDESVTYVPEGWENSQTNELYLSGPEQDYEKMDNIEGISLRYSTNIMVDCHDGYIDATFDFQDDGTVTIETAEGDSIEYKYLISELTMTLISDDCVSVYSVYQRAEASSNLSPGHKGGIVYNFGSAYGPTLIINEETTTFFPGKSIQELLDEGYTMSLDSSQLMASCVVSDAFTMQKGSISITVKAVNPWDTTVPLSDCKICYVYTAGAGVSSADGSQIGVTTYDNIEWYYSPAYEKTDNMLKYKVTASSGVKSISSLFDLTDEPGEELLDYSSCYELELIYNFEDGVLCSYEIQCPELLYNGLQDSVQDTSVLEDMTASEISGIVEVRDSVLDQLKAAFTAAGLDISINENTGEIVMDTSVLFDYDSSELTAEGQAYIDSFMGVYASVILNEELQDVITEVRFEGHTDSSGTYSYNLELSQARADAVLDYCLSSDATSMNYDQKSRLNDIATTIGYSFTDLVYDEEGEEDADASRRVAIKFFISTDATADDVAQVVDTTIAAGSALTEADFVLTYYGEEHDAITELVGSDGNCFYFHYDSSEGGSMTEVLETARGIHIGDSANDVYAAYGETDIYTFDSSSGFYSESNSEMLDNCSTYVVYWYGEAGCIAFFMDSWNCVSWIVYFVNWY